jgi:hypothetical protein
VSKLWSREFEILLAVARAQVNGDGKLHAPVAGEVDWDKLLAISYVHKMMPLLSWHLIQSGRNQIPPDAQRRIKEAFQSNAAWNITLSAELCRVAALLAAAGIPVIPYKGPALASQLYGNLALRQCSDLDLLVRVQDIHQARAVLISNDYSTGGYSPGVREEAARDRTFILSECDETFVSRSLPILLELHWAVVPPYYCFPLDTGELIARSQSQLLLNCELRAFAPEDLLLVLCVHASKGMWQTLEWTCAIGVIASRLNSDQWMRALHRAKELGAERILLLGIRLCQRLLGVNLPFQVMSARVDDLAQRVEQSLPDVVADLMTLTKFRLAVRERWRDRIKYCWRRAVRPTYKDASVVRLPTGLFFLYYMIRPFRLLRIALTRQRPQKGTKTQNIPAISE